MEPIRLHMNEMPFAPPAEVVEAARAGLESLHRYCSEDILNRLRDALAAYVSVPVERVMLSPGSDILLRDAINLFAPGRKVVTLCPSFLPATHAARQAAGSLVRIRLPSPDFALDRDLVESEIEGPTLVLLDIPNNPTGKLVLSPEEVESLLHNDEVLIIVDEAYSEVSGVSCSHLVNRYPNLLVTRSLDKVFSLAGARIGYGLAGDVFLKGMSPFFTYLPQSTVLASLASLEMAGDMLGRVKALRNERDVLLQRLRRSDIEAYESTANFLLVRSPDPRIAERLEARGILVQDVSDQMPPGFIRVTVGTPQENERFVREFLTP
jgi:histidinol-phosphate aminotransferase